MNKNKIFSIIAIFFMISLVFSCQKEKTDIAAVTEAENNNILSTEEENCDKMVHTAALGVLELSKNPDFRELVHQKCLQMFDGDYNVLLKDLVQPASDKGIELNTNFLNSINSNILTINSQNISIPYGCHTDEDNINAAINGFTYYDDTYYLQLYVPNFENENTVSDEPNVVDNTQPIIVISPEDEATPYSYVLQEDGTFKAEIIDESYLDNHLIWVISINERIKDNTFYAENQIKPKEFNNGLKSQNRVVRNVKAAKISEIQINARNEGWLQGRSDIGIGFVHIKAGCIISDIVSTYPNSLPQSQNYGAGILRRVKTKCLNQWLNDLSMARNLADFPLATSPTSFPISALEESEDLAFVIYESDTRRKFEQSYSPCGNPNTQLYFTARQSPYIKKAYNWYDMPNNGITKNFWENHVDNDMQGVQGKFRVIGKENSF